MGYSVCHWPFLTKIGWPGEKIQFDPGLKQQSLFVIFGPVPRSLACTNCNQHVCASKASPAKFLNAPKQSNAKTNFDTSREGVHEYDLLMVTLIISYHHVGLGIVYLQNPGLFANAYRSHAQTQQITVIIKHDSIQSKITSTHSSRSPLVPTHEL